MTRPTASNTNALRSRLDRLEGAVASHPGPGPGSPLTTVLTVLAAVLLGDAGPKTSIAEGLAHALGLDGPRDLRIALTAGSGSPAAADLSDRWRAAMTRLLALKNASPDCDGPTFAAAVEALFLDMPEEFQRHPMLVACGVVDLTT